jgi:hypothetical protein
VTVVATRFDGRARPPRDRTEPTVRRTSSGSSRRSSAPQTDLGIDIPEFVPGG